MSLERDILTAYDKMSKREPISIELVLELIERLTVKKEPISAEMLDSILRKLMLLKDYVGLL